MPMGNDRKADLHQPGERRQSRNEIVLHMVSESRGTDVIVWTGMLMHPLAEDIKRKKKKTGKLQPRFDQRNETFFIKGPVGNVAQEDRCTDVFMDEWMSPNQLLQSGPFPFKACLKAWLSRSTIPEQRGRRCRQATGKSVGSRMGGNNRPRGSIVRDSGMGEHSVTERCMTLTASDATNTWLIILVAWGSLCEA